MDRPNPHRGPSALIDAPTVSALASTGQLVPGGVFAHRYEILGVAGIGGMGTVYRARDRELDDVVALKVLRTTKAAAAQASSGIRQEVRAARRVASACVARTYEFGVHDDRAWLTMEYVEGESLQRRLASGRRLGPTETVALLRDVADGLGAVHAAGVVHRDIKPGNILVRPNGRAVITDFGLAHIRAQGQAEGAAVSGTPAYMAPEQVAGSEPTALSDQFSLAVVAFELLTGQLPWQAESAGRLAIARLTEPAPDPRQLEPTLPERAADAMLRALARDPSHRFATPADFVTALVAALPPPTGTLFPTAPLRVPAMALNPPLPRLAVLPFRYRGGVEDALLGEGLGDDLVGALSTFAGIRVLSPRAVERYLTDTRDSVEIGTELQTDFIVEGQVRIAHDRCRVNVRMVAIPSGEVRWATLLDRGTADLLQLQDELAAGIRAVLTVDEPTTMRAAVDPHALALFLRAQPGLRGYHAGDVDAAIGLLREAHALAPAHPSIGSSLALALVRSWTLSYLQALPVLAEARDLAEGVIRRGEATAEAHLALGTVLEQVGDPARAAREFRRAILLAPSLAAGHERLGSLLIEAGHVAEGDQRIQAARELDPGLVPSPAQELRLRMLLRPDAAFDDLVADLLPSLLGTMANASAGLVVTRLRLAAWQDDKTVLAGIYAQFDAEADEPTDPSLRFAKAYCAALLGLAPPEPLVAQLTAYAQGFAGYPRRAIHGWQLVADLGMTTGRPDIAMDALRRAVDLGMIDRLWLERCPVLRPLANEPGWSQVETTVRQRADAILDALWEGGASSSSRRG